LLTPALFAAGCGAVERAVRTYHHFRLREGAIAAALERIELRENPAFTLVLQLEHSAAIRRTERAQRGAVKISARIDRYAGLRTSSSEGVNHRVGLRRGRSRRKYDQQTKGRKRTRKK
jgi:2-methylcitrate dehydratase PrpD